MSRLVGEMAACRVSELGTQVTLFFFRQPWVQMLFVSVLSCWLAPMLEKQELPAELKAVQ